MTPQEHIARAEQLLTIRTVDGDEPWELIDVGAATSALAHALIAVAVELGAPHPSAPQGATSGS